MIILISESNGVMWRRRRCGHWWEFRFTLKGEPAEHPGGLIRGRKKGKEGRRRGERDRKRKWESKTDRLIDRHTQPADGFWSELLEGQSLGKTATKFSQKRRIRSSNLCLLSFRCLLMLIRDAAQATEQVRTDLRGGSRLDASIWKFSCPDRWCLKSGDLISSLRD